MSRSRATYLGLVVGTMLLGLASRHFRAQLPTFIAAYAGDTLWAAMVYFLAATFWRHANSARLAVGAMSFSFAVELSQLYQAPWINTLRATRLGGLILGFGFLWSDLLCYAVGIALAVAIDSAVRP